MHSFIMRKDEKKGEWETLKFYIKGGNDYKEAHTRVDERNYVLFGKLAGVRTLGQPLVEPRGWPDDLPQDVLDFREKWVDSLHTPTWYDYMELKALSQTPQALSYYFDDDGKYNVVANWLDKIDMILDAYYVWPSKPGEVRIVIVFDS